MQVLRFYERRSPLSSFRSTAQLMEIEYEFVVSVALPVYHYYNEHQMEHSTGWPTYQQKALYRLAPGRETARSVHHGFASGKLEGEEVSC